MKNILIGIIVVVVVLAGAGAVWAMKGGGNSLVATPEEQATTTPPVVTVCTQEAKICPDGSAVGRTGPSCEFAACPTTETESTSAALNQRILLNGVHITPLEVVEDSRCPIDVQCIQAGTVRIRAKLENGAGNTIVTLTLNKATTYGSKDVTLTAVAPVKSSKTTTQPSDYRFTFSVTNTATATGTLSGTMTIGPVCPVEQVNNPCKPSAQMYAARKVAVYKADKTTLVTTLTPDANGKFSAALAAGTYYVNMASPQQGGVGGVSGVPATIVIQAGVSTPLSIDVDTGIR